jgi:uncharacterized membrane protein YccC
MMTSAFGLQWIIVTSPRYGSRRMLGLSSIAGLMLAALVIGPFNTSVPGWLYQSAWLCGAFAVFALVCNYESGSEG